MTQSLTKLTPPKDDEIEISLFGPGFGESIVIHTGYNDWIIIDSCKFRGSNKPAAIDYFESLSISPNVKLICASHWHDDHIKGLVELLDEYKEAVLVISAALRDKKFSKIVLDSPASRDPYNNGRTGIKEIQLIYEKIKSCNRKVLLAQENMDLYENKKSGFLLRSISPNPAITIRSIVNLIESAVQENPRMAILPDPRPNDISVALQASFGGSSMLLGADLESPGWDVAIQNAISLEKSSVYKVAHHGGKSGDHKKIWSEALANNPVSVVAPFRRGNKRLPTKKDIERLTSNSGDLYITTQDEQKTKKYSQDKYVQRSLNDRKASYLRDEYGQICLRKKLNVGDDWGVTLCGRSTSLKA